MLYKLTIDFSGNVTLLNITVVNRTKNAVLVSWRPFAYEDRRALLGYVIYSTEVANRNVTLYEGRDACGGDGLVLLRFVLNVTSVFHYC